jgi:hypothetical protein
MADNVSVTQGSGTVFAADDIGSVFYPRTKISVGADGSATDMTAGSGAIAAGTPRVCLATDSPGVISTGTKGVPSSTVLTVQEAVADTGTQSSVAASTAAVTVLAANTARMGAAIYNDSAAVCHLILSATTPSTSAYTVRMQPLDYYEPPAKYTGIIQGIWVTGTGSARVTELT